MLGERILPWYFLAFDGRSTHGYGVATGANSFAFWQADPDGISLWLDVRIILMTFVALARRFKFNKRGGSLGAGGADE